MNSESSSATRLLLISNSTLHGSGYLDHAASEISDFLGDARRVLIVPFALHDVDKYAAQARARFEDMGYELASIHTLVREAAGRKQTVGATNLENYEAIFIGGG